MTKSFGRPGQITDWLFSKDKDQARGIYSICSSNRFVIEAGMQAAKRDGSLLLIEATCNQVNQYGGYTQMKPGDFAGYVFEISQRFGFPEDKLVLGGDHLGPYPWRKMPSQMAMAESETLIHDYVAAGFRKIHIDTSVPCSDDQGSRALTRTEMAKRAARMCKIAENTISKQDEPPLYVIGSEVPAPGGQADHEEKITITSYADASETMETFRNEFLQEGLHAAWDRVIALVVQPRVEFSDTEVHEYDRSKVSELIRFIDDHPGKVFEAHSTDYQTRSRLREMVEDGFSILKVGPALTYAFREVVFGLAMIEEQLLRGGNNEHKSNLIATVSAEMDKKPELWKGYLTQSDHDIEVAKLFGFSDRIRYFWDSAPVSNALAKLFANLENLSIPLTLISQYLPVQYRHIREKNLNAAPENLIHDHIITTLNDYAYACGYHLPD